MFPQEIASLHPTMPQAALYMWPRPPGWESQAQLLHVPGVHSKHRMEKLSKGHVTSQVATIPDGHCQVSAKIWRDCSPYCGRVKWSATMEHGLRIPCEKLTPELAQDPLPRMYPAEMKTPGHLTAFTRQTEQYRSHLPVTTAWMPIDGGMKNGYRRLFDPHKALSEYGG